MQDPRPLRSLSEGVGRAELPVASVVSHPWSVPVGLDLTTLDVVALQVHEGEHVLIAGPARSGVSNALGLVGAQLASSHNILALCHGSVADARNARFVTSLGGILAHDSIESAMSALASAMEPCVLVIDDADRFGDEVEALLASDRVGLRGCRWSHRSASLQVRTLDVLLTLFEKWLASSARRRSRWRSVRPAPQQVGQASEPTGIWRRHRRGRRSRHPSRYLDLWRNRILVSRDRSSVCFMIFHVI